MHLDDAQTVELIQIARLQFEQLSSNHPETCRPMFLGESFGDIAPYISADVATRERNLFQAAFRADMTAPRAALSDQALGDAVNGLIAAMRTKVGDDVSLITPGADISGHEKRYCEVVATLYREMEAMPSAEAASLMRGLAAAG
jgi:hypothetical protein